MMKKDDHYLNVKRAQELIKAGLGRADYQEVKHLLLTMHQKNAHRKLRWALRAEVHRRDPRRASPVCSCDWCNRYYDHELEG